jgi:hypothetical protein
MNPAIQGIDRTVRALGFSYDENSSTKVRLDPSKLAATGGKAIKLMTTASGIALVGKSR